MRMSPGLLKPESCGAADAAVAVSPAVIAGPARRHLAPAALAALTDLVPMMPSLEDPVHTSRGRAPLAVPSAVTTSGVRHWFTPRPRQLGPPDSGGPAALVSGRSARRVRSSNRDRCDRAGARKGEPPA